jgi:hypothetical protein
VQHGRSGAEPSPLDGLQVEGGLADKKVQIIHRIGGAGYDPTTVPLNSKALAFTRETNPYRTVGAEVPMTEVLERLTAGTNELRVCLGDGVVTGRFLLLNCCRRNAPPAVGEVPAG